MMIKGVHKQEMLYLTGTSTKYAFVIGTTFPSESVFSKGCGRKKATLSARTLKSFTAKNFTKNLLIPTHANETSSM